MHVLKARNVRPTVRNPDAAATGRMQAQKLIDLIDATAPDEGVVDVHALENSFANGSRRIALVEPKDAVVEAIVEGGADSTRRMSAVEADALVAVEIRSESTMRMSAIQESELVALITPAIEAESNVEPVVRFTSPKLVLPIPAPVEDDDVADEYMVEPAVGITATTSPVRRRRLGWMALAFVAFASASAALVLVALERI